MNLGKYFFGINITKYIKDHEYYIEDLLDKDTKTVTDKKLEYHTRRLEFLQHERFIHLVVTFMTLVACLFFMLIFFTVNTMFDLTFAFLAIILFILFLFYIKHYFFLENHVQYWYILYDKLQDKLEYKEG